MKKTAVALAMILAALALAACGGDDDTTAEATIDGGAATETEAESTEAEGGASGGGIVAIEADPEGQLAYTTTEASAEAGEVAVEFTNESAVPHDVDVEDAEGNVVLETEVITESGETTSAELEAGEYTFFCSVPGHRQAGMEGTLTVE